MSRRREGRTTVEIAGRCVTRWGTRDIFVSDLSLHGCQMSLCDEDMEPGDRVCVELSGVGPFAGQIRWMRVDRDRILAGVEFDMALHPALVQHFSAYCRCAG